MLVNWSVYFSHGDQANLLRPKMFTVFNLPMGIYLSGFVSFYYSVTAPSVSRDFFCSPSTLSFSPQLLLGSAWEVN